MRNETANYLFNLAFVIIISCPAMMHATDRPTAPLGPPTEALQSLHAKITSQDVAGAELLISQIEPANEIETLWLSYLRGLLFCEKSDYDAGIAELMTPVTTLRQSKALKTTPDRYRIAAKCLKKIGWCYRKQSAFEKAYAIHEIAYEYQVKYGCWEEVHDACISLDVDAFNLNDYPLSEVWLRRGLEAARNVAVETVRVKSLGMCYNNLAGSLQTQGRHEEAEEAAKLSFEQWKRYEQLDGVAENRLVWAWFCIGDVFEFWAKDDKTRSETRTSLIDKARAAYSTALELGRSRGMTVEDLADIQARVDTLK